MNQFVSKIYLEQHHIVSVTASLYYIETNVFTFQSRKAQSVGFFPCVLAINI